MEGYKPRIGKNVIETLTLGMYENPYIIYREYVQNATDQIDIAVEQNILDKKNDGKISILINKDNGTISIEDNATGIKSSEVLSFLGDVANSQKDRDKHKGFRGIGRLGGLGYCNALIFETSYKEEPSKSTITLDAKQLKRIIEDKTAAMDASTVMSVITSLETLEEEAKKHYFKVKLEGVTNDLLLQEQKVKEYLSMVAPIPFSKSFSFAEKIYQYFRGNNIKIEEYDVCLDVNSEKLYKAYKNQITSKRGNKLVNVIDVGFIKIKNNQQELIALAWYSITDLLNNIIHQNNIERGFRIRKNNIQIGSEDTLNNFFTEDRFNHHFIGEIYVIGSDFIPNARRDYFNDNETILNFASKLKIKFRELYELAHIASKIHVGIEKIRKYQRESLFLTHSEFDNQYAENIAREKLKDFKKNAEIGRIQISKNLEKSSLNKDTKSTISLIFKYKKGDQSLEIGDLPDITQSYDEPNLPKLDDKGKEIVLNIFKIIEQNIDDSKIVIDLKNEITAYYS